MEGSLLATYDEAQAYATHHSLDEFVVRVNGDMRRYHRRPGRGWVRVRACPFCGDAGNSHGEACPAFGDPVVITSNTDIAFHAKY